MAYHHRKHFVDPNHLLTETEYNDNSTHTCDICLLELAGHAGYGCTDCGIHIHKACADQFEKFTNFFADRHRLKLIRTPPGSFMHHVCDLCKEKCPPSSFVYRCDECNFDLHPLCSLLPETVESPIHPGHRLHMITSPSVSCFACHEPLPLWHYVCSCSVNFKLHIACAMDMDEPAAGVEDHHGGNYGAADQQRGFGPAEHQQGRAVDQRGFGLAGHGQGGYHGNNPVMFQGYSPFVQQGCYIPNLNFQGGHGHAPGVPGFVPFIPGMYTPTSVPGMYTPPIQPGMFVPPIPCIYGHPIQQGYGPAGIPGQNAAAVAKPSRCSAIAKFLLKQSFNVALTVATGGLVGSPMVDLLSTALNN
ncbi:hypothetical protein QOZ80_7BG0608070 [Eleusine coracana subsp. coracana]|nr:hypothetical protein QOZ80_7BG0608070 [Eleusine coracana subsp. coracana]